MPTMQPNSIWLGPVMRYLKLWKVRYSYPKRCWLTWAIAMGPVIASIHEKRDEFRRAIKEAGSWKSPLGSSCAAGSARKHSLDRVDPGLRLIAARRAAALRHFRSAATALPAHRCGRGADQIGCRKPADKIG
jgi:hypothetical protein